ncbi:MAG: methyltransferase domain-containing protein [bacterium]|nr:methyltransferase domain-containing protein [bacterium]
MQTNSWMVRKVVGEKLLPSKTHILDLGCGEGQDALTLAMLGHEVDAVDRHRDSIATLTQRSRNWKINTFNQTIESFSITPGQYGAIIANNSLPFLNSKVAVELKIKEMFTGVRAEGILALSLFGPRDGWFNCTKMSFFEYDEALKIIENTGGKIYYQSQEEGYGLTMQRRLKFWHIFRFILIKK